MSLKMTLGTGEEIDLAEFGHNHLVVLCESLAAFRTVEDKVMAEDALAPVEVADNEQTIAAISGMRITGAQTVDNGDGSVTGHFYTTGGTYELGGDYAEAGRILLGEEE